MSASQAHSQQPEKSDAGFLFPSSLQLGTPVNKDRTPSAASNGFASNGEISSDVLMKSVSERLLSIQRSIDQMKRSQAEQEQSLRGFIQQELHALTAAGNPGNVQPNQEVQSLRNFIAEEFKSLHTSLSSQIDLAHYGDPEADVDDTDVDKKPEHIGPDETPKQRESHMESAKKWMRSCDQRLAGIMTDRATARSMGADVNTMSPGVHDMLATQGTRLSVTQMLEGDVGQSAHNAAPQNPHSHDAPHRSSSQKFRKGKSAHGTWSDFQASVNEVDETNLYNPATERNLNHSDGCWQYVFASLGLSHLILTEPPRNGLAKVTQHGFFVAMQAILIIANAIIMGVETDQTMVGILSFPQKEAPKVFKTINLVFNIIFALEVCFRIVALRSWFFVNPQDWHWNMFDILVVLTSIICDFLVDINLSFMRTFRILRAVRAARIIRVLRFFRELRKILFAILASIGSLLWCFGFLSMTMFMMSILLMQGAISSIEDANRDTDEFRQRADLVGDWYGSVPTSMFSLLLAFTGGTDWYFLMQPLKPAGYVYCAAFVVYILFVTVGVMNVLTGVFLASADDFADRDLIVQNEQVKVEAFVRQMLDVFAELDVFKVGHIDWETFRTAMSDPSVQAYLAAYQLEPTHTRLLFDLLDEKGSGTINVHDFVMGMVRLKGEAKAIDARIIQRELTMLPSLLRKQVQLGPAALGRYTPLDAGGGGAHTSSTFQGVVQPADGAHTHV